MNHVSTTRRSDEVFRKRQRKTLFFYASLSLVGAILLAGRVTGAELLGAWMLFTGGSGLAWEAWRTYRSKLRQQAALHTNQRQAERKTLRRIRQQEEQAERQQERERKTLARQQQAAFVEAGREARRQQVQKQVAAQRERQQHIATEAARLHSLPDADFRAELPALFLMQGLRLELPAVPPVENDFLFVHDQTGKLAIARMLPGEHIAAVADIEELEQSRRESGAEHAYLVSRNGFSPQAVRLVAHFPVTLVEPHLLAAWKQKEPTG